MSSPSASPPVHYQPGVLVAQKYLLSRLLGEGGMGTVWLAHNLDLEVDVAIKLIRSEVATDQHRARFGDEARVAARLNHPGIIKVFDFGHTELGDPFIVMELLQGESLGAMLNRLRRIEAPRAVQLLLPIIDALSYAHRHGVVHRDLKPENIFLTEMSGGRVQPKLLDFGIAQAEERKGPRLTTAGSVLGSPEYMSPEQASGDTNIDSSSDIWSLSVVLYELCSGVLPFQRDNYNATLRAIIDGTVPPLSAHAAGDAWLWTILQRGLEKSRSARWLSMEELGAELAAWLWDHGVTEDAARASLRATWLNRGAPTSEDDPFSVPPVTLSRQPLSIDPVAPMRRSAHSIPTTASGRAPRLSTGGHGAVALRTGAHTGRGPSRVGLWFGGAAAVAVVALGAALWIHSSTRPSDTIPSAVSSADTVASQRVELSSPPVRPASSAPPPAQADAGLGPSDQVFEGRPEQPAPKSATSPRPRPKPRAPAKTPKKDYTDLKVPY